MSFLSASLCLQLKKLWGKADPVQTKYQLFETKLLLQRGPVMELHAQKLKNVASVKHFKRNTKKVADISDSPTAIMQSSCN